MTNEDHIAHVTKEEWNVTWAKKIERVVALEFTEEAKQKTRASMARYFDTEIIVQFPVAKEEEMLVNDT